MCSQSQICQSGVWAWPPSSYTDETCNEGCDADQTGDQHAPHGRIQRRTRFLKQSVPFDDSEQAKACCASPDGCDVGQHPQLLTEESRECSDGIMTQWTGSASTIFSTCWLGCDPAEVGGAAACAAVRRLVAAQRAAAEAARAAIVAEPHVRV